MQADIPYMDGVGMGNVYISSRYLPTQITTTMWVKERYTTFDYLFLRPSK